ncbi:LysM peptidoglycan-binding domain-containing protein [Jeotgalibacillus salarius]|uniref:LysM peptidoglycan-binding domain-containing protein n=1 Tax=Jeotgalibacillus salarius TaxID=546023 RepID=A0A4Y8LN37_9BACL|nr:LysM peptidoglycan-binding domain-containing protein [Jeotgalibacillus salarius]TFE04000.1 LysM peptidoglycan-binding domain-containing protein [Jeotgalibacillus salarius]
MKKAVRSSLLILSTAALFTSTAATASGKEYTVKKGDTLFNISKEYNISLDQLKKLNHLKNDKISLNQNLIVIAEEEITPSVPKIQVNGIHHVKSGDTLSKIASTHNLTVNELKSLNKLNSDNIFAGQSLHINKYITTSKTYTAAMTNSAQKNLNDQSVIYEVKAGDSLSKIASQNGVTVPDLVTWNQLATKKIIPGQKLNVKFNKIAPTPPNNTPPIESDKPSAQIYTVKAGDSLSKIAALYSVTIQQLIEWNKLTSTVIYVNQTLSVHASKQVTLPPSNEKAEGKTYKIKPGDSLFKIALTHGVTMKQLMEWNKLSSVRIFVDQTILIEQLEENIQHVNVPPPETVEDLIEGPLPSLVEAALKQIGVPYLWAGTTPEGFDCSGFIYYVMNQSGNPVGRHNTQGYYDRSYEVNKPAPGDLVFFENTYKSGISHVGIYIGNNQMIHAADNIGIIISSLDNSYWKNHFESFKRFY